jgi:hypothetical protein
MRPRWKTVIGVLGIIFGCFGIMSASQTALMPTMLEIQRKMFLAMQAEAAKGAQAQAFAGPFAAMFEMFAGPTPAWFAPWCVVMGLLTLIISGLYVFSAISLLLVKPWAPRLFCIALTASIVAAFARTIGLMLARGVLGMGMGFGAMFGVVIDVVLLLIVLAHKSEWSHALNQGTPPVHDVSG